MIEPARVEGNAGAGNIGLGPGICSRTAIGKGAKRGCEVSTPALNRAIQLTFSEEKGIFATGGVAAV